MRIATRFLVCVLAGVLGCHASTGNSDPATADPGAERLCGSRGLEPCPEGTVCLYPESAACGETDAPGICTVPQPMCTREYDPVCGCDGRTHPTACVARAAGVSVRHRGACEQEPAASDCVRGGCSGQLCVEPGSDAVTTCIYRPEFACYRSASCERQADGTCGFTRTPALEACLAAPPAE